MQFKPITLALKFIDAGDALGEVLFGLIMALTFTMGARLVMGEEGLNARELVVATLGCNIAWGLIDSVLYLLGTRLYRRQRARFIHAIKAAESEESALSILADEFPARDAPLALNSKDRAELLRQVLVLTRRTLPSATKITVDDLIGAFIVLVIVAATAIPAVIPFLLIDSEYLALRTSNLLLVALLYATGHAWASVAGSPPVAVGAAMTILGLGLVTIALILGG
jgi:hypothetical protein